MVRQLIFLFSMFVVTSIAFNNCSPQHTDVSDGLSSTLGADSCEQKLMDTYKTGYHVFLQNNCNLCHVSGPGKGAFASGDLKISYDAFKITGYDVVSNKAIDPNHQSPYTGPQHQQAISNLKVQWSKASQEAASCGAGGTNSSTQFDFKAMSFLAPKAVPDTSDMKDHQITWNLESDFLSGPNPDFAAAQLTVTVRRFKTSTGEESLVVTMPTLTGATNDIRVKGIFVKINGTAIKYATTFAYVDQGVNKNSDEVLGLLSGGAMIIAGKPDPRDQLQLGFMTIEKTSLPPPLPTPSIQIIGATNNLGVAGDQTFQLQLSAAAYNPVSVAISVDGGCAADGACSAPAKALLCTVVNPCTTAEQNLIAARSVLGQSYNRFDWDYKLSQTMITFLPGETTKTITVTLSKDVRKESNRLLSLQLTNPLGALLPVDRINYVIRKMNNSNPPPGVATFSQLMGSSLGIFSNCIRCHNSNQNDGGYDITDFEGMLAKGVLIPNDINCKMRRRMIPDAANVTPMPLDGYLPQEKVFEVDKWIQNGALNN